MQLCLDIFSSSQNLADLLSIYNQQAKSGIYKVLGDQVRSEPDRIFSDPFKLQAKLETGHFAYPFVSFKFLQLRIERSLFVTTQPRVFAIT